MSDISAFGMYLYMSSKPHEQSGRMEQLVGNQAGTYQNTFYIARDRVPSVHKHVILVQTPIKAFVEGHANFDCSATEHLCPAGRYKLDQAARSVLGSASLPFRLDSMVFLFIC